MGLKMVDWHDASTLAAMSDGEIFDLIVKGKGKMIGEGDRVSSDGVEVGELRALAREEGDHRCSQSRSGAVASF
jgi:hypothetical protein